MKLKYIATVITASIVTIGGTALFSHGAIASNMVDDSPVLVAGNPCAANPCAANPCAANPCAANPCAANPCAANPCAANPCAANPCAANPCAANPCAANPCAANPCAANPCAAADAAEFVTVGSGKQTQGTFSVVKEDGKKYIEFSDDFKVSRGPDLKVILHIDSEVESSIAESDYITLAPIESFSGTQRYAVPDDVDLNDYASVAIWCEEFNVIAIEAKIRTE